MADIQPVPAPRADPPDPGARGRAACAPTTPIAQRGGPARGRHGRAAARGPGRTSRRRPARLVGPRQVVTGGNTVGIADPTALGTGSSVREGIDSDRDVHGAKTGDRASVNTAVGPGGGRGTGGEGTGPGGRLLRRLPGAARGEGLHGARQGARARAAGRSAPTGTPDGSYQVTLRFRLDPSGSASEVEFRGATDDALGKSAADAMRAASPFDQMNGQTRCLAGNYFNATFKLESIATSN